MLQKTDEGKDEIESAVVPFGAYSNIDQKGFKKHHQLIVMKPAPGHVITLMARKFYNSMLAHTQQRIERMGVHKASEAMECSLAELMKKVGIKSGAYGLIKNYISELENWKVRFESPNNVFSADPLEIEGAIKKAKTQKFVEQTIGYGFLNMLASCRLMVDHKNEYFVRWSFAAEVYEYFEALNSIEDDADKQYVYIDLSVVSSLGTYAALVLYEICSKFKGIGRTGDKPHEWWQAALTGKHVGENRRVWRKFKSETIVPALEEINSLTDVTITLEENKSGPSCCFRIAKKNKQIAAPKDKEYDAELIEKAKKLAIPERRILELLNAFGEQKFKLQLDLIEKRIADKSKPAVRSNYALLKTYLETADQAKLPLEPAPVEPNVDDVSYSAKPLAVNPNQIETEKTKKAFEARKTIQDQLKKEPKKVIQQFLKKAQAELERRGTKPTLLDRSRIEEGSLTPGMLGTIAVDIYANEIFGPDWMKQSSVTKVIEQSKTAEQDVIDV